MLQIGDAVTVELVTLSLEAPQTSVYLFFGTADSPGGQVAQTVHSLFPALDVYITTDRAAFAPWWPGENPTAVVFTYADEVYDFIADDATAGRLTTVRRLIREARQ